MVKAPNTFKQQRNKEISNNKDTGLPLWALLFQTRDIIAKARNLELNQYNLTGVQFTILFILINEDKPLSVAEIASLNMREPSAVLNLVSRMERMGLVKKTNTSSKGKLKIVVTEEGVSLYNSLTQLSLDMIFNALNEDEKRQLTSILRKLRVRGRELLGIDYKPPFLRTAL